MSADQPRIRWCVEHGQPYDSCKLRVFERYLDADESSNFKVPRCRVVDAIVCVVPS